MDRYQQKDAYQLKANRIRDSWANAGYRSGRLFFRTTLRWWKLSVAPDSTLP